MIRKVVLVIRPQDKFSALLKRYGFEVISLPLIHTEPVEDLSKLKEKIRILDEYDGLFFTSPAAARVFLEHVDETPRFRGTVYVLGERTRNCFAGTSFSIAESNNANTVEDLIRSFDGAEFKGRKFLFFSGDKSLRAIPRLVGDASDVDEIVVYKSVKTTISRHVSRSINQKIEAGAIDWICFFSPSAVDAFFDLFTSEAAKTIKTAVIGETTGKRASEAGLNLRMISKRANTKDFADGLAECVKQID